MATDLSPQEALKAFQVEAESFTLFVRGVTKDGNDGDAHVHLGPDGDRQESADEITPWPIRTRPRTSGT